MTYTVLVTSVAATAGALFVFAVFALLMQAGIDFGFLLLSGLLLALMLVVFGLLLICGSSFAAALKMDLDLYCSVIVTCVVAAVSGAATGIYIGIYS